MEIQVTTDESGAKVLAVYIQVREGEVYRTVPIKANDCYADENVNGDLLGVEVLAPGRLRECMEQVAQTYGMPQLASIMESIGVTRAA
ncbi:hypothetical protein HS125_15600 [bacterium]|nr:hypothetical protein [bacterium]